MNCLTNYLKNINILYKYQFEFREKYGTHLALILLENKIDTAIDDGKYSICLFLDLSKAFDTIDHKSLLTTLEHYVVRGLSLQWFANYLTDRRQYVSFNDARSITLNITCSVPQGSILRPLLVLIYVNDLATVSEKVFSILFADDTNIFLSGYNLKEMTETFNVELTKIQKF